MERGILITDRAKAAVELQEIIDDLKKRKVI